MPLPHYRAGPQTPRRLRGYFWVVVNPDVRWCWGWSLGAWEEGLPSWICPDGTRDWEGSPEAPDPTCCAAWVQTHKMHRGESLHYEGHDATAQYLMQDGLWLMLGAMRSAHSRQSSAEGQKEKVMTRSMNMINQNRIIIFHNSNPTDLSPHR